MNRWAHSILDLGSVASRKRKRKPNERKKLDHVMSEAEEAAADAQDSSGDVVSAASDDVASLQRTIVQQQVVLSDLLTRVRAAPARRSVFAHRHWDMAGGRHRAAGQSRARCAPPHAPPIRPICVFLFFLLLFFSFLLFGFFFSAFRVSISLSPFSDSKVEQRRRRRRAARRAERQRQRQRPSRRAAASIRRSCARYAEPPQRDDTPLR